MITENPRQVEDIRILVKKYLKELKKSIKSPKQVKKDVDFLITNNVKFMEEKWISGKKYLRTYYAFKCIEDYPLDVLALSIAIDSIINALDDLLDENLKIEEKVSYICILIENLSLMFSKNLNEMFNKEINEYFSKILSIAVGEQIYQTKIKKSRSKKELFINIHKYYKIRSLDIDIYFTLPLTNKGYKQNEVKNIIQYARIFRIINLFLKDLKDLKHDLTQNIFTPVTYLYQKNKKELLFSFYQHLKDIYKKEINRKYRNQIKYNISKMLLTEMQILEDALKELL